MKKWEDFTDKAKEVYKKHTDAILKIVVISLAIVMAIAGYLISWNVMIKPLNDNQFELCEQVARDVYAQTGNLIVEVPQDFSVDITETTIEIKYNNTLYRGKVIAKLQNAELVMTRDMEVVPFVSLSVLVALLFALVTVLIVAIINAIYQKIKTVINVTADNGVKVS